VGFRNSGKRTTLRWLGSTAIELKIVEPTDPFATAEVVIALEPRDLGWLQALARARGRRDLLIMRGRLRRAPRFELEAGAPRGWTGGEGLRRLDRAAWQQVEWGLSGVEVLHSRDADPTVARAVWEDLSSEGLSVWRVAVRRDEPHVQIHVELPDVERASANDVVRNFIALGRGAAR
jgi:hypothetical protein